MSTCPCVTAAAGGLRQHAVTFLSSASPNSAEIKACFQACKRSPDQKDSVCSVLSLARTLESGHHPYPTLAISQPVRNSDRMTLKQTGGAAGVPPSCRRRRCHWRLLLPPFCLLAVTSSHLPPLCFLSTPARVIQIFDRSAGTLPGRGLPPTARAACATKGYGIPAS